MLRFWHRLLARFKKKAPPMDASEMAIFISDVLNAVRFPEVAHSRMIIRDGLKTFALHAKHSDDKWRTRLANFVAVEGHVDMDRFKRSITILKEHVETEIHDEADKCRWRLLITMLEDRCK